MIEMVRSCGSCLVLLLVLVGFGTVIRAAEDGPVTRAAKAGDLAGVLDSIAQGADVHALSGDGSTPLLWAAYHFDVEMAEALVAAGADVDVPNNYGVTPLLQASRTGDAQMIQVLLDAGADASLAHMEGETPLMAASRTGLNAASAADELLRPAPRRD